MQTILDIETSGPGLYEFTNDAVGFIRATGVTEGLLHSLRAAHVLLAVRAGECGP
jgi:hypothetical protein